MKEIREKIFSYIWFKAYTSGLARIFRLHRSIPDWSEVWEEVMPKVTRFNQRHIPACVAHATVTSMQIEWYRRTGRIINFSPRFLDILSWTDGLGLNDGRDPTIVTEMSINIGCCTEDLLVNDTTLPIDKYRNKSVIRKAMMKEAAKYKMANLGLTYEVLFDDRKKRRAS